MKRTLLIIVSVLLVILVGGGFYLASNAKQLISSQIPQIEKTLSEQLDAKVSIGDLGVGIFPSVQVTLDDVAVKPKSGEGEGIGFDAFELKVELLPLLSKTLVISTLSVDSPKITIIKDEKGVYPAGLPPKQKTEKKKKKAPAKDTARNENTSDTSGANDQKSVAPPLDIALKAIEVNNASLLFDDRIAGKQYPVSNINISLGTAIEGQELSLSDFELSMKLLDALSLEAETKLLQVSLDKGVAKSDALLLRVLGGELSSGFNVNYKDGLSGELKLGANKSLDLALLGKLKNYAPALETLDLKGGVSPSLEAKFNSLQSYTSKGLISLKDLALKAGPAAVSKLGGDISLKGENAVGSFSTENLALTLGDQPLAITFQAAFADKVASLTSLTLKGFGGQIDSSASISMKAQPMSFNFATNGGGMSIKQLLGAVAPGKDLRVEGSLSKIGLELQGALGADLMKSLKGKGGVLVEEGTIRGLNIANQALSKMTGIPFLDGSLLDSAPEDFNAELNDPDTAVRELKADFVMADGNLNLRDFNLLSTLFLLKGKGNVTLPSTLDLNNTIIFNKSFSSALVIAVKELKNALDDGERLNVPLRITGTPPNIKLFPDVKELLKLAASAKVKEKIGEAIGGKIKGKGLGNLLGF